MTGWSSRQYRVVHVRHHRLPLLQWWVVSEDLTNPSSWVVINEFATSEEAFAYVAEVTARQKALS